MLNFEVGKKYVNRAGDIVTCVKVNTKAEIATFDDGKTVWIENGCRWRGVGCQEDSSDIILEYTKDQLELEEWGIYKAKNGKEIAIVPRYTLDPIRLKSANARDPILQFYVGVNTKSPMVEFELYRSDGQSSINTDVARQFDLVERVGTFDKEKFIDNVHNEVKALSFLPIDAVFEIMKKLNLSLSIDQIREMESIIKDVQTCS